MHTRQASRPRLIMATAARTTALAVAELTHAQHRCFQLCTPVPEICGCWNLDTGEWEAAVPCGCCGKFWGCSAAIRKYHGTRILPTVSRTALIPHSMPPSWGPLQSMRCRVSLRMVGVRGITKPTNPTAHWHCHGLSSTWLNLKQPDHQLRRSRLSTGLPGTWPKAWIEPCLIRCRLSASRHPPP